jgi:hypothetical protein
LPPPLERYSATLNSQPPSTCEWSDSWQQGWPAKRAPPRRRGWIPSPPPQRAMGRKQVSVLRLTSKGW